MHYHITRIDYDTLAGRNLNPVEIGTVASWQERNLIVSADEAQFRLPSSPRHLLHEWQTRQCRGEGCRP